MPILINRDNFDPSGRPLRGIAIWISNDRERALRDLLATAARRADTEDAQRLAIELEEALNQAEKIVCDAR